MAFVKREYKICHSKITAVRKRYGTRRRKDQWISINNEEIVDTPPSSRSVLEWRRARSIQSSSGYISRQR